MNAFLNDFCAFVEAKGGRITATDQQGSAYYLCAILPPKEEVQRGDMIQGGLSLVVQPQGVQLQGYVLRETGGQGILIPDFSLFHTFTSQEILPFRAALPSCAATMQRRVLPDVRLRLRTALGRPADDWYQRMVIAELGTIHSDATWIDRLRQRARQEAERQLPMQRLNYSRWRQMDHAHLSRFDVMIAVSSLAQDASTAKLRQQLEALTWRLLSQEASEETPSGHGQLRGIYLRQRSALN
jgi:hypothetical protein